MAYVGSAAQCPLQGSLVCRLGQGMSQVTHCVEKVLFPRRLKILSTAGASPSLLGAGPLQL